MRAPRAVGAAVIHVLPEEANLADGVVGLGEVRAQCFEDSFARFYVARGVPGIGQLGPGEFGGMAAVYVEASAVGQKQPPAIRVRQMAPAAAGGFEQPVGGLRLRNALAFAIEQREGVLGLQPKESVSHSYCPPAWRTAARYSRLSVESVLLIWASPKSTIRFRPT